MRPDRASAKRIVLILFAAILFVFSLIHISEIVQFLGKALNVFLPVILGLCFAFVVNPLLSWLERAPLKKLFGKCRHRAILRRTVAVILTLLIVIGVIAALLLIVIPQTSKAIDSIARDLPAFIGRASEWLHSVLTRLGLEYDWMSENSIDWPVVLEKVADFLKNGLEMHMVGDILGVASSVVSVAFNLVLGVIISIYVLMQKERIGRFFRRVLAAYLSERAGARVLHVCSVSHRSFSNFVTGQLVEAVIIGVLCAVGMLLFRFPYALVISAVVAATALIPVFGAWFGGAFGALLIVTVNPMQALLFIIYLVVLQQLEGDLIYPRVVGKSMGLPGILVMIVVIVGGNISGVLGMLLSVPLSSVFYVLLNESMHKRIAARRLERHANQSKGENHA